MATAELAVALPAVILVLAFCLTGLALGIDQLRCEDAARVAARAASRGEAAGLVQDLALSRAPEGARVRLDRGGDTVIVEVTAPARVRQLPMLPAARGRAEAVLEPGARP